jgi:hypothetical protein
MGPTDTALSATLTLARSEYAGSCGTRCSSDRLDVLWDRRRREDDLPRGKTRTSAHLRPMRADHPQRLRERTPQTCPGASLKVTWRRVWVGQRLGRSLLHTQHEFRSARNRILAVGVPNTRCVRSRIRRREARCAITASCPAERRTIEESRFGSSRLLAAPRRARQDHRTANCCQPGLSRLVWSEDSRPGALRRPGGTCQPAGCVCLSRPRLRRIIGWSRTWAAQPIPKSTG